MKTLIVIPARYASTRFPGKILAPLAGKPMIQWTWEAARRCKLADDVIVATDDARIVQVVEKFGGKALMTDPAHPSGTDRVAEVARQIKASLYINLQGDEPLLKPEAVDALISGIGNADMATLAHPLESSAEYNDPAAVKVALNAAGEALYFSRSPIPHWRDGAPAQPGLRHIGIYAFTAHALQQFVNWPQSPLEQAEKLEQLRALENGLKIKVIVTPFRCVGVDTPQDLAHAEQLVAAKDH
jgi:3-deoxy-manno-octulosonate cytidylyltransferase (CMP-KDO synthetase)